jgi:hypothetical protein
MLMKERISALALASILASSPAAWAASSPSKPLLIQEPIVNGLLTSDFPSVGLFVAGEGTCTGTLIGCQTVLTAAHCVCEDAAGNLLPGPQCRNRPDLLNPSGMRVFFQHAGLFQVSSVTVNPDFLFQEKGDLAILHLASPVTGIAPTAINTAGRPPFGTPGLIAGFGTTRRSLGDVGLKRAGQVMTGPCASDVNGSRHVCWSFTQPVGAPGVDSDTCGGDSGGPLFIDAGAGLILAGVTSGGNSTECIPPDESWDADVFVERAWIQSQAAGDLGTQACGGLPAAGSPEAPGPSAVTALDAAHPQFRTTLEVPPGVSRLRVTLNADHYYANDFDLYLSAGSPPTINDADCSSESLAGLEFCEVRNPAAGTWHLLANRANGAGPLQLTATLFGSGNPNPGGPCVRDATTACLQSGRFEVKVDWRTASDQGTGKVMSFGGQRTENDESVFWWFFNASNFEMGVKVLNGCGLGGKYWVFVSGLTDQGWTARVRDTQTGVTKTYSNAVGHLSSTSGDTAAFNCQ